jgi:hypothetical protein
MYCFNTPKQEQKDLDAAGNFTRENFICGMFDRALETLERYSPDAFHSLYLPAYVISALCKNLDLVEEIMCCSDDKQPEKHEERPKSGSEAPTGSDWEDDFFPANPLFEVLEEMKGERIDAEPEPRSESEPERKPEKTKKKSHPCGQNHHERLGLLRKKYNLTFL